MDENEIFLEVFNYLTAKYPSSKVDMQETIVQKEGKPVFNTDGYNLLYNLTRLCKAFEEELL